MDEAQYTKNSINTHLFNSPYFFHRNRPLLILNMHNSHKHAHIFTGCNAVAIELGNIPAQLC